MSTAMDKIAQMRAVVVGALDREGDRAETAELIMQAVGAELSALYGRVEAADKAAARAASQLSHRHALMVGAYQRAAAEMWTATEADAYSTLQGRALARVRTLAEDARQGAELDPAMLLAAATVEQEAPEYRPQIVSMVPDYRWRSARFSVDGVEQALLPFWGFGLVSYGPGPERSAIECLFLLDGQTLPVSVLANSYNLVMVENSLR